jgi:peptidase M28-like protein/PA domain-containing protein
MAAWLIVPTTAGAISSAACNARPNDTPKKLVECIKTDDLWQHMQALQAIADANPGPDGHASRNAGEPGYKASVDYVAAQMRKAGYGVRIQTYTFDYFVFTSTPTMSEVSPTAHDYGLSTEFNPGLSIGTTSADLQPVGHTLIPPTGGSTSGCDPSDFSDFVAGRIALIQRGTCTFSQKAENAQAAGATGVIIFNEGNTPERTSVFSGSLTGVPTIPVAFTSFAIGNDLYNQYQQAVTNSTALPHLSLNFRGIHDPNREDYNVIAESKGGDPDHVLVVDAHLDAIYGAGMLDNGSGSATILDIAQKMHKVDPRNKLRFIWFGGEELGLLGSHYYVDHLSASELGQIRYDLDADVTATPNYIIGVLDPAGVDLFGRTVSTQFPPQVYEPSKVSRDQLIGYFDSIGKQHETFSPVGTDAFSFNMAGVPASGVLTGQDCCKSQAEVDMFGGFTGNFEGNIPSFDGGCVDNPFRWCDNLDNNDKDVMTFVSKAFADTTVRMAFDKSVIWADQSAARKKAKLGRTAPRESRIR